MGTTTQQIGTHIERTREALGSNLDELEQKVKAATDWRHHFQTKPVIFLGIAFCGGVLASAVFRGRGNRSERRWSSESGVRPEAGAESTRHEECEARQTWKNVKGAILAVATTRLLNYAGEVFLEPHRKPKPIGKARTAISPQGE